MPKKLDPTSSVHVEEVCELDTGEISGSIAMQHRGFGTEDLDGGKGTLITVNISGIMIVWSRSSIPSFFSSANDDYLWRTVCILPSSLQSIFSHEYYHGSDLSE